MKNIKTLVLLTVSLSLLASSCTVHVRHKHGHDNGKHKGWYKNPNNPHHPKSTNPGKGNQKSTGNPGKGKKK